jgi:hypothetical protein
VHDEEASESQIRPKWRPSFRKVRQRRRYSPFRADLTPDAQADAVVASVTRNYGRDREHSNERRASNRPRTSAMPRANFRRLVHRREQGIQLAHDRVAWSGKGKAAFQEPQSGVVFLSLHGTRIDPGRTTSATCDLTTEGFADRQRHLSLGSTVLATRLSSSKSEVGERTQFACRTNT